MITIIGAGPVGCHAAFLLAKAGEKVRIFEEHSEIGKPIQCTGIVTKEIEKIIDLKKDFVLNELKGVKVFSKNSFVEVKLNEIVLDREKFDKYLAKKAAEAGVKIFLEHKFIDFDLNNNLISVKDLKNNKIKKINTNILIGADGPMSAVAQSAGLLGKREFYFGMQARVKVRKDNFYEVYFGKVCPGFFAWIIPESREVARVGLASKKDAKIYFNQFIKKLNNNKIIDRQFGLIPIFNPNQKIKYKNIYLVGDAALQVKATTGGGIVPGLISARILADCIVKNKSYEKEFKKTIGKELNLNLKLRRILNKFNDKDYNYLVKLMSQKRIKKILNKYNRDKPSRLLLKLLVNEPRFLCFVRKVI